MIALEVDKPATSYEAILETEKPNPEKLPNIRVLPETTQPTAGSQTRIVIESLDDDNRRKTKGGLILFITITKDNEPIVLCPVKDNNDGTYLTVFPAPAEGEYYVKVKAGRVEIESASFVMKSKRKEDSLECSVCGEKVFEEHFSINERHFHIGCFKCDICERNLDPLHNVGYVDQKIYCSDHYKELFIKQCHGCAEPITGIGLVAFNKHYHPECFVCKTCGKKLLGRRHSEYNGMVFCAEHGVIEPPPAEIDGSLSDFMEGGMMQQHTLVPIYLDSPDAQSTVQIKIGPESITVAKAIEIISSKLNITEDKTDSYCLCAANEGEGINSLFC